MNQIIIIKIYTIFTQQQDTNSIQIAIDYKPRDMGIYPGDIKQGTKMSWSKGIEIIQNLFSCHCGIILEINIKRYLKITHIFSNAMWYLPKDVIDLNIESLKKVRMKKTQKMIAEKKVCKGEINIKDTLKKAHVFGK